MRALSWAALLVFLLLPACTSPPSSLAGFDTAVVEVDDVELTVLVADTGTLRRRGLRDVEELPAGVDGMIFVYSLPSSASFGMLNTPMPLDIWWFDESGVLVGSASMEPCLVEPCASYRSPGPIMWTLETPALEYGFQPGAVLSTG